MKYGDTLRQRSIPAWKAYNIDYDDIKRFIKKRTTAGNGESISVPGQEDEKLTDLDKELTAIFAQQHERIDMFARSKLGEIQRRREHAKRKLKQLSSVRQRNQSGGPVSMSQLERYSALETDVMRVGEDLKSLSRFTSANRTAFRKLIKKARKWTRCERLCARFQEDVLNDPSSFTQVNFTNELDDYSETLSKVRQLYEERIKSAYDEGAAVDMTSNSSTSQRLQAALKTDSKVGFDTAFDTVPLGKHGALASYFVHPDNLVELQVLLLQHLKRYSSRSRQNSLARSRSNDLRRESSALTQNNHHMSAADDLTRLAKLEGAVTVAEREHTSGLIPQRCKYMIRWNDEEDAVIAARSAHDSLRTAPLKRKHADAFFTSPEQKVEVTFADEALRAIREQLARDTGVQPLYHMSTIRHRFCSIAANSNVSISLASLDTDVMITTASSGEQSNNAAAFPFAVLQVRLEGKDKGDLLAVLDSSHLTERVRGFSLQYHALWQIHQPQNVSVPFWLPILSRDIRKLPPPPERRKDSVAARESGSGSANQQSTTQSSVRGLTDETTAVESPRQSSAAGMEQLEPPPLKAFRKKRRRQYADESEATTNGGMRYWSEYDHPEEGEGANDFMLYFNPNEPSKFDQFFDRIGSIFTRRKKISDEDISGPGTPKDDDESSDDEEEALSPRQQVSYGTLPYSRPRSATRTSYARAHERTMQISHPQATSICSAASLAMLFMTAMLVSTSKHKYAKTVDTAVLFGIGCSLFFAASGFIVLMRQRSPGNWSALGLGVAVLFLDAIACGGLLAWVLG